MQFLCSEGQPPLPPALCTFSVWALSPARNTSIFWCERSKRNKRNKFDQFFIAFHNLRRFYQFPYKSAFYLPENCISLTAGFPPTLARHYVCPLLPPSLPPFPVFCSELRRADFMSALVSCISSSVFLCSNVVARSVRCPSCYHDMSSKDFALSCSGHSLLSSSALSNCFHPWWPLSIKPTLPVNTLRQETH